MQHQCQNEQITALNEEDMKDIIVNVEQDKIAPSKHYDLTFKALTNGKKARKTLFK